MAKRLGRGLDSLITNKLDKKVEEEIEKSANSKGSVETYVKLSDVEPDRGQPRHNFEEKALNELAESIKVHGIIQPIVVTRNGKMFKIIAGERRWRAARLAGLTEVPVLIKDYSEQEAYEVALIENIQRQNLNAIEEAVAYQKLISEFALKQEELATRVSKSRSAITNSMRLLKLDDSVKQLVIDGKLSGGHARTLVSVKNSDLQLKLAMKMIDSGMSVRDAEQLVKDAEKPAKKPEKKVEIVDDNHIEYAHIEEELKQILGTKVSVKKGNNGKGKIEIEYYSVDELERLIAQLGVNA